MLGVRCFPSQNFCFHLDKAAITDWAHQGTASITLGRGEGECEYFVKSMLTKPSVMIFELDIYLPWVNAHLA